MKKVIFSIAIIVCSAMNSFAQTKKVTAAELPEYIVITAESTKLIGGIGILIDKKNSPFKDQFDILQEQLDSKKSGSGVRTLTDLLNAMSDLGFEYVNAFAATSTDLGGTVSSIEKNRNNIVFRKKK